MSLWQRLFGSRNLSREWVADPTVPLEVELDACRFCGVGLGGAVELLRHLGPSTNSRSQDPERSLVYPDRGFQIFLDGRRHVDGVDINLVAEVGWGAFTGTWSFRQRPLEILPSHTPSEIEALLGVADQRTEKGAPGLCYLRLDSAIWFEWGDDGQLLNVLLTL